MEQIKKILVRLPLPLAEKLASEALAGAVSINTLIIQKLSKSDITEHEKTQQGLTQAINSVISRNDIMNPKSDIISEDNILNNCDKCQQPTQELRTLWHDGEEKRICYPCVVLSYGKHAPSQWRKLHA